MERDNMKKKTFAVTVLFIVLLIALFQTAVLSRTDDDIVFIHHSCGENWLSSGLENGLLSKSYIDEVNDITYGSSFKPDNGRPESLWDTPGDNTDMVHWILWFNDYMETVKAYGTSDGENRIILFKSCYPNNNVQSTGCLPGNPFSYDQTVNNYKAIFTFPSGVKSYKHEGYNYEPLDVIFAENPDTLFIFVTTPALCHHEGNPADGSRARIFYEWVTGDWLNHYNKKNPGLNNVAVFDWFDFLAYDKNALKHANLLKFEYGGNTGDSHPNDRANRTSTTHFITGRTNQLDAVWEKFSKYIN
jgi:hypothetical protein